MRKGQNVKYEKTYFQGFNSKDGNIFIKIPSKIESKNVSRKSKTKKRK